VYQVIARDLLSTITQTLGYPVSGVTSDSRQVIPNGVFVALVGTASGSGNNGHHYVDYAITQQKASVVVIQEDQVSLVRQKVDSSVLAKTLLLTVPDTYVALAQLTSALAGYPSLHLSLIGVTIPDQNPSTITLCHATIALIAQLLANMTGKPVGELGLSGWQVRYPFEATPVTAWWPNTPPWSEAIQAALAQMIVANCHHAVMGLHPLGLIEHRYDACHFAYGLSLPTPPFLIAPPVLDNATPIALDSIKITVFSKAQQQGISGLLAIVECPVQAINSTVFFPFLEITLIPVVIGVLSTLRQLLPTLSLPQLISQMSGANALTLWQPWCSLYNSVNNPSRATVFVDSAQSPAQIKSSLKSVKLWLGKGGHLWLVVGCPGEIHPDWRIALGTAVAPYVDKVVLTADNPRNESVDAINHIILQQWPLGHPVVTTTTRQAGIAYVLQHAKPQDCILIAGKGRHYTYQILADAVYPWCDEDHL
jgi:UDP-N-acetylmuramoyl-L-alanyl-D-glutamate--2,6-diaminopimelate ligase